MSGNGRWAPGAFIAVLLTGGFGATRLAGEIVAEDRRHFSLGSTAIQAYTTAEPHRESGITAVLNAVRFGPDGAGVLDHQLGKGSRVDRLKLALVGFPNAKEPLEGERLAEAYAELVAGPPGWPEIGWETLERDTESRRAKDVHGVVARSMKQKIPVILEFRRFVLRPDGGNERAALRWQPAGTLHAVVESVATTCADPAKGFFLEIVCPRTGKILPWLASLAQRPLGPPEAWAGAGIRPAGYLEAGGPGWELAEDAEDWPRRSVILLTGAIGAF